MYLGLITIIDWLAGRDAAGWRHWIGC